MTLQSPLSPRKDWSYDKYFQSQIQKRKKETEVNPTSRYQSNENYRPRTSNEEKN